MCVCENEVIHISLSLSLSLSLFPLAQGPDDGSDWSLGLTVPGASSTRANITKLLPFTYYFVRVDAVLRDGRQITSDPHGPTRTLEDGEES